MFFLDNCKGLGNIVALIKAALNIALILIGVALVVLVIIDIAKAIIASEEKEVKGYQKAAIRRVIYFVVIFFVVTVVSVIFNLVGDYGDKEMTGDKNENLNWKQCWNDPRCEKDPSKCLEP